MPNRRSTQAFSLIEVVIALAILVFAGFGLVGLMAVGLQGNRDSREQLQAATLAEFFCSTRRAAPLVVFAGAGNPQPDFPIPVLSASSDNLSSPTYLTWDGAVTTLASGTARFGLLYTITPSPNYVYITSPGTSTLYLCLFWPPQGALSSPATSHFELTTTFALP